MYCIYKYLYMFMCFFMYPNQKSLSKTFKYEKYAYLEFTRCTSRASLQRRRFLGRYLKNSRDI